LKRQLGVCYRTAWLVKHKLMQVMREREADGVLNGLVIANYANLGGERRGKCGHSSENIVSFIAAVDDADRPMHVRFNRIEGFCSNVVSEWAKQHLALESTVVSDGLAFFTAATAEGCHHEPQMVGATRRRSTNMPCVAWVNTMLGNLKTALSGTYHTFNYTKYADRYFTNTDLIDALTLRSCCPSCCGPR
jgi:ISXO2-like transposase domain